jgi:LPXTG-motif cell wall-anchored protein
MIKVDLGPLGFIPEPSSIVLAGTSIFGLFGALMALRRRKKN